MGHKHQLNNRKSASLGLETTVNRSNGLPTSNHQTLGSVGFFYLRLLFIVWNLCVPLLTEPFSHGYLRHPDCRPTAEPNCQAQPLSSCWSPVTDHFHTAGWVGEHLGEWSPFYLEQGQFIFSASVLDTLRVRLDASPVGRQGRRKSSASDSAVNLSFPVFRSYYVSTAVLPFQGSLTFPKGVFCWNFNKDEFSYYVNGTISTGSHTQARCFKLIEDIIYGFCGQKHIFLDRKPVRQIQKIQNITHNYCDQSVPLGLFC